MGRNVQGYAQGETREYIPKAFDNRKDPDPVVVVLKTMTEGDKRALLRQREGDNDLARSMQLNDLTIRKHVTSVRNYTVRGKPVTDAESLLAFGEHEMLGDITGELWGEQQLSEDEKKTSAVSSDSSATATTRLNGTVTTAAPQDSVEFVGVL